MNVQTSKSTVNKMENSISSNIPFNKKHYHLAMNIRCIWKKHWIDKLQPSLNMKKPSRTKQEWTVDHRAKIHARARELRELKKRANTLPPQETLWLELLCIWHTICILILIIVIYTRKLVRYIIIFWFFIIVFIFMSLSVIIAVRLIILILFFLLLSFNIIFEVKYIIIILLLLFVFLNFSFGILSIFIIIQ